MEVVAWVGSVLLAVCAVPQAVKSFCDKNADNLSGWFLAMWGLGEILLFGYTAYLRDWALMFNYGANIFLIAIIVRYKVWPKYENAHTQDIPG